MGQEACGVGEEVEQLRQRLDEFRSAHALRSRLPESLWTAAAELAKRHGVYQTARALHLDYAGLKKRIENHGQVKRKRAMAPPGFMEFIAPGARPVTDSTLEVESAQGSKLRLNLQAIATTELVNLIRAFVLQ
jgi:2-iminoacetate synthase ThiH